MRMLKTCVLVLLVLAAAAAAAEEKFDPAARAKAVAPFVDQQTFGVLHLDFTRVALEPLLAKVGELIPEMREDLAEFQLKRGPALAAFTKAGGKDVYYVFTMARLVRGVPLPVIVVPLHPDSDEKGIRAAGAADKTVFERIGDALVLPGEPGGLERIRRIQPEPRPELAAAFEAAGDTAVQLLLVPPAYSRRVIEETMPQLPEQIGGGPSTALTRGVLWAAVGIDLPPNLALRLVVKSQDAQAAQALQAKWIEVLRILGRNKEVRKVVTDVDWAAALLRPKADGDRLTLVLDQSNRGVPTLLALLTPPLETARQDAKRRQSVEGLKQLTIAMHNHHDTHKTFPAAATYSPDGKPLLSWRVQLLPYLEQRDLYEKFHLDEPWDSPHNRALIAKMPPIYRSPASKLREKGKTNFVVPVGPGTCFPGREGIQIRDISDGTSNTIMILEVNDDRAVTWTRPDDLPFDPKQPLTGLGGLYKGGFNAALCDGAVMFITVGIPPDALRLMVNPSDGQPVPEF